MPNIIQVPVRQLKKSVELRIDPVDNLTEIFLILFEIQVINIDNQHFPKGIMGGPCLVTLVQLTKVIEPDAVFIVSAALLDVVNQGRHCCPELDHQGRGFNQPAH